MTIIFDHVFHAYYVCHVLLPCSSLCFVLQFASFQYMVDMTVAGEGILMTQDTQENN